MHTRIARGILLALIVLSGWARPRSDAASVQASSDLRQAMATMPAAVDQVYFTDWALIKHYEGMSTLTSKSPMPVRKRFMLSLVRDQAAASSFGAAYFFVHAVNWGWDSTDLAWEASGMLDSQSPVYVLKLRDDFDLAPVRAHFVARGFSKSVYRGAVIYSHALDLSTDWIRTTELAILNTAVLATPKLLVLSSSLSSIRAVLDAYAKAAPSLAANTAVQATAVQLGMLASGVLVTAPCRLFSGTTLIPSTGMPAAVRKQIEPLLGQVRRLHAYAALGLGYREERKQPIGLAVLHYLDAGTATADLSPRNAIAANGISLMTAEPYRTAIFTLLDAAADANDLVLHMRPVHDMPRRLFSMVQSRDMLFAACP